MSYSIFGCYNTPTCPCNTKHLMQNVCSVTKWKSPHRRNPTGPLANNYLKEDKYKGAKPKRNISCTMHHPDTENEKDEQHRSSIKHKHNIRKHATTSLPLTVSTQNVHTKPTRLWEPKHLSVYLWFYTMYTISSDPNTITTKVTLSGPTAPDMGTGEVPGKEIFLPVVTENHPRITL